MIYKVKLYLRITTDVFDDEITDLINASYLDLGIAGVDNVDETDPLIVRAVCTYCKMNFGFPTDKEYQLLKASYDEQKAQMSTNSNYTRW